MKNLLLALFVVGALLASSSSAEARWCRGGCGGCYRSCYTPCYTSCYTPCYTSCYSGGCYGGSCYAGYSSYGYGCNTCYRGGYCGW